MAKKKAAVKKAEPKSDRQLLKSEVMKVVGKFGIRPVLEMIKEIKSGLNSHMGGDEDEDEE